MKSLKMAIYNYCILVQVNIKKVLIFIMLVTLHTLILIYDFSSITILLFCKIFSPIQDLNYLT